jgi:hypothetical protein
MYVLERKECGCRIRSPESTQGAATQGRPYENGIDDTKSC